MIEQLSAHGVIPSDLTPSLMKFAKVKNPLANLGTAGDSELNTGSTVSLEPSEERRSQDSLHVENPKDFQDQRTVDIDIRWTLLCDLFLVLISDSIYDARSRTLLEGVGQCLEVSKLEITKFEEKVTNALEIEESSSQTWKETEIMESRRKKDLRKKYMYVGLATVGGGLVLGLSAGMLAPVIGAGLAAGFTTIGITGTSGFLAGAGGAAIVTTTGAVMGVKIGSQGMSNRMGHVQTFEFRPLHNHKRVNLILTVSGWMSGNEDDVRLPFSTVDPIMGDVYSLLWEPEMLKSMGQTINILATEVLTQSIQQVLGATVLVALMSSLQLPMALSKLGYLLDNPWNVSLDRAWTCGLILAETLINRNLGVRPVTLVGFSLGARVIYSCLVQLARKEAYGLVQDVFIFGAPVVVKQNQFAVARSVVSGRFVNGYSKKDWILGYLFRATSGGLGRVAGLAPVEKVHGVENFDNTEIVDGHMGYRKAMPTLLSHVGWEVLSEDFAEIEDPDPERHRERQRQLIEEFDAARKQMEEEASKQKKKKKSFFSWNRQKEKDLWEMYDRELESKHKEEEAQKEAKTNSETPENASDILFDVNAIQKELVDIAKNDTLPATKFEEYVPTQPIPPTRTSRRFNKDKESIEMSFDPFEDDHDDRLGGNSSSASSTPVRESFSPVDGSSLKAPTPASSKKGRSGTLSSLASNSSTSTLTPATSNGTARNNTAVVPARSVSAGVPSSSATSITSNRSSEAMHSSTLQVPFSNSNGASSSTPALPLKKSTSLEPEVRSSFTTAREGGVTMVFDDDE